MKTLFTTFTILTIAALMLTSCNSNAGNTQSSRTETSGSPTASSHPTIPNTDSSTASLTLPAESSASETTSTPVPTTAPEPASTSTASVTTSSPPATEDLYEYPVGLEFAENPIIPTNYEMTLSENIEGTDELEKYRVRSIDELLKVLGRNRIIYLYPGNYDFYQSDLFINIDEALQDNFNNLYYQIYHAYSPKLIYTCLKNTIFIGVPSEGRTKTDILTNNSFASVMMFEDCADISLINLNIVHPLGLYCNGSVLDVKNTRGISIENCTLSGYGATVISAVSTQDVTVKDSKIIDCSFNLLNLSCCSGFVFNNTEFSEAGSYHFYDDSGFEFKSCFFTSSPEDKFNHNSAEDFMSFISGIKYPINNGDIFRLKELLAFDNLTKDDLIDLYGKSFYLKEGYQTYNNGLKFKCDSENNNEVTHISFGNVSFNPKNVRRLAGHLDSDGIIDRIAVFPMGYSVGGILIISDNPQLPKFKRITAYNIDTKLVDVNNDGIDEIYIADQKTQLFGIRNGELIDLFDELAKELKGVFEYEMLENELYLAYKPSMPETSKFERFTIPEKLIYKIKRDNKLIDVPVLSDALDFDVVRENDEWAVKVSFNIHLKTTEYYYGPLGGGSDPFEMSDLMLNIGEVILSGRYNGSDFVVTSVDIVSRFDEGDYYSAIKHLEYGDLGIDGLFGLDAQAVKAIEALNGNAENYSDYTLSWGSITIDDVTLWLNEGVCNITIATDKYATPRGLKVGDTRETLKELYGYPDVGSIMGNNLTYYLWSDGIPGFGHEMKITLEDDLITEINFWRESAQ